jgi:hypothetical protein
LFIFYHQEDELDSSIIKDSGLDDISEETVALYRNLRAKVNPYAEELQYETIELLQSLACLKKDQILPDVCRLIGVRQAGFSSAFASHGSGRLYSSAGQYVD